MTAPPNAHNKFFVRTRNNSYSSRLLQELQELFDIFLFTFRFSATKQAISHCNAQDHTQNLAEQTWYDQCQKHSCRYPEQCKSYDSFHRHTPAFCTLYVHCHKKCLLFFCFVEDLIHILFRNVIFFSGCKTIHHIRYHIQ